VKEYLEEQRLYMIAGDSAYPISEVLLKPYSSNEAAGDFSMRYFNSLLSGARTVMSENVFATLKKRFPILRKLR
jgi:hypothetical protein